ncbi:MAG: SRPBCC family protein [Actinomycetota bacterium]
MTESSGPTNEVSREIAAAPEVVFAAITDITRMGEWSPETVRAEWNEGFTTAAVGAQFSGYNEAADEAWTTRATITEFVENERFFFECDMNDFVFATWGYVIEPIDSGCRVTELTENHIPEKFRDVGSFAGIENRDAHNRETMIATLDRLAAALEA